MDGLKDLLIFTEAALGNRASERVSIHFMPFYVYGNMDQAMD